MKPLIICIVGDSGCGKTYMAHYLCTKHDIPFLTSMTTRPRRDDEDSGVDHSFITQERMNEVKDSGDILAYTKYGDYEYCTTKSMIKGLNICSYVIDESGLKDLIANHSSEYGIIKVYIEMSDEKKKEIGISQERIDRDKKRERLDESEYHYVIENNGTLKDFEHTIDTMW